MLIFMINLLMHLLILVQAHIRSLPQLFKSKLILDSRFLSNSLTVFRGQKSCFRAQQVQES
jgi:hypothetical protein